MHLSSTSPSGGGGGGGRMHALPWVYKLSNHVLFILLRIEYVV